jgi:hypothetical protein
LGSNGIARDIFVFESEREKKNLRERREGFHIFCGYEKEKNAIFCFLFL